MVLDTYLMSAMSAECERIFLKAKQVNTDIETAYQLERLRLIDVKRTGFHNILYTRISTQFWSRRSKRVRVSISMDGITERYAQ